MLETSHLVSHASYLFFLIGLPMNVRGFPFRNSIPSPPNIHIVPAIPLNIHMAFPLNTHMAFPLNIHMAIPLNIHTPSHQRYLLILRPRLYLILHSLPSSRFVGQFASAKSQIVTTVKNGSCYHRLTIGWEGMHFRKSLLPVMVR